MPKETTIVVDFLYLYQILTQSPDYAVDGGGGGDQPSLGVNSYTMKGRTTLSWLEGILEVLGTAIFVDGSVHSDWRHLLPKCYVRLILLLKMCLQCCVEETGRSLRGGTTKAAVRIVDVRRKGNESIGLSDTGCVVIYQRDWRQRENNHPDQ